MMVAGMNKKKVNVATAFQKISTMVSRTLSILLFLLFALAHGAATAALTSATIRDAAEAQTVSVPTTMIAGQQYTVFIGMLNDSGQWAPFNEYALLPINPVNNNVWGVTAVPLTAATDPGTPGNFSFNVIAPSTPGTYNFQWQMAHGSMLFGKPTANQVINVVAATQTSVTMTSPLPVNSKLGTQYSGAGCCVWVNFLGQKSAAPGTTITKVEVLDGSNVIPYSDMPGPPNSVNVWVMFQNSGKHLVSFRVTDSSGGVALSAASNIYTSGNGVLPPPSAILKFPNGSVTYSVPPGTKATVPFIGSGFAASSSIAYVQLFDDQAPIALLGPEVTSGSVPLAVGVHTLRLRATDILGVNSDFTAPATVTVTETNLPPLVNLGSPSQGDVETVFSGTTATVRIGGFALDPDGGAVSKLELLDNGSVLMSVSDSQLFTNIPLSLGSHALQMRATDGYGAIGLSEVHTVSVLPYGQDVTFLSAYPTATTGSADAGSLFNAGLHVDAKANDMVTPSKGYVRRIELREGNSVLASQDYPLGFDSNQNLLNNVQHVTLTSGLSVGMHQVYARAYPQASFVYTQTNYVDTPLYTITVTLNNKPPIVSMASPSAGATILIPQNQYATIPVVASAIDPDGTVALLEVLQGDTVLLKANGANINDFLMFPVGDYTLRLRATDNSGAVTYGDNVSFSIRQGSLLGAVTELRSSPDGHTLVVGWTCQDTVSQALRFEVHDGLLDDRAIIGTGIANVATEPDNAAIQAKCHTPGAAHHFVFDMSTATPTVYGSGGLFVKALPPDGSAPQLLPCAAASCAVGSLQMTVLSPGDGSSFANMSPVTIRFKISGGSEPYDEVSVNVDGGWGPTQRDTDGTYVTQIPFSTDMSHTIYGRVRQGKVILDSSKVTILPNLGPALLGTVSEVRINAANNPELVGWVCQQGVAAAVNYQVLLDAPTAAAGGTQLTSGVANLATEPDNAAVQAQCSTPGAGHHFVVDLTSYVTQYAGRKLYVHANDSAAINQLSLPCADNSCTLPGTMRIGLTTPADGDQYVAPATVFMRARITGSSGPFDEVAFSVDGGSWIIGAADTVPGTYFANSNALPARPAPYTIQARVRQGNTTIYTVQNMITVLDSSAVQLTLASSSVGGTVVAGNALTLSATPSGAMSTVGSVQFYANGVAVGTATHTGGTWLLNWTPAAAGTTTVVAKAFDSNGALLAASPAMNLVVTAPQGGASGSPVPVTVTPPAMGTQDAGSLPGALAVGPNGDATYSMALVAPPGTAGMQPALALNYSSSGTNGIVGLGWSLGGLSSIHRCGKTIAQDNVNAPIGFTTADRLCLDGQRLVRVNPAIPSTADQATQDAAYWAAGGEYRTELDSLSRITAVSGVGGAPAFKVEGKDGKIRYYGCDVGSSGCAGTNGSNSFVAVSAGALYPQDTGAPNKVGQAISWALSSIVDRSGNHIDFDYSLDAATGEHLPKQVRYGGNFKKPQNHYAAVRFSYLEPGDDGTKGLVRPDAWTRYIADARNDLRHRLFNISTYISTAGAVSDASGTLVRQYTLAYEQSLTSGRSLLDSVTVCATDSAGVKTCQLPTTFNWGKPSGAAQAFVSQNPGASWGNTAGCTSGAGNAAPCLMTHGTTDGGRTHSEYFEFSDFENNGLMDVLEKRVADPSSGKPQSQETPNDGYAEFLSNPQFKPATLQKSYRYFHNTGTAAGGFQQYSYSLDTNEYFAVLAVSDFDGDGYPDLLVLTSSSDSAGGDGAGVPRICLSPLASGVTGNIQFKCNANYVALGDNSQGRGAGAVIGSNQRGMPTVIDVVGDGRANIYGPTNWDSNYNASATLAIQGQTYTQGNLPPMLQVQNVPNYVLELFPYARGVVSPQQMVDFSGTGKLEIAQWSLINKTPICVGPTCDPCPQTASNCYNWNDTVPVVRVNAFPGPGLPTAPVLGYTHPDTPPTGSMFPWYSFGQPINLGTVSADFNGSGYNGLFYDLTISGKDALNNVVPTQGQHFLCLSTGQHLDCAERTVLHGDYTVSGSSHLRTLAVGDFDGDGQPDVLVIATDNKGMPVGAGMQLCHLTGDTNVNCSPWTVPGIDPAALGTALFYSGSSGYVGDQVYVMDLMGTGRPQLMYYHAGSYSGAGGTWVEDGRWEVFAPNDLAKTGEALDRIVSVKNGWGGSAAVTYADALKDNVVGQSGGSTLKYPQRLSARTGKIVSALTTHIGVDQTGADAHTQVFNYRYWDAATDAAGRGSLGFGLVSVLDVNSGITTDTVYQQAWPLTGMVQSVTSFNSKGTLSSTSNAFQVLPLNGGATSCPYVSGSTTVRNDLDNLLPLGQTDTTTLVDSYCNVQQSTVSSWTDANKKYVTDTLSTLNNLPDTWQIGQVVKVQTTKTDPDSGSVIRRVGYGYNLTTGLLESETVEPDATVADYKQYQLTTSYGRDPNFGMVTTVSQDWTDPAGYTANWGAVGICKNSSPHHRVVSTTAFDAQGRFPQSVTNALCQIQSVGYDAGTGAQVSVTDPNNLTTTRTVDGFGRLLKEVAPDNNETRHYLKTCDGVSCPLGASVMQVVEFFNGASRTRPPQVVYSDYAGHVLRSQSWGLDTAHAIVADQRYDGSGRLQEADWPRFDNAAAVLARHIDYDALNRVVRLITYDEAGKPLINQTDYLGLSLQLTNPLLYTRTEKHNVLGQLQEVVDAKNGSTRFGYEPFGNLATTTDPNNNVITVVYDRWGHKTELHDPDLGFIQYQVDPVGMTWAQISPRQRLAGTQTTMKYDPLNRMTARDETDLLSRWVYDTAAHGVGQLAEAYTANSAGGKDYDRTHAYTDKGLPQSTTQVIGSGTAGTYVSTTAYDSWDRPMTQSYQHGADAAKVFGLAYGQTGGVEQVTRGSLVLWQLTQEDASLRATSMALGNGLTEVKNYDLHTGRLMNGGMNTAAATVRLLESYQYDVLGSVLQRNLHWSTGGFSETFSYDELNRLKTSQVGNNALLTYQYDAAGSIQSKTDVANNAAYLYPAQGVDARQYDVQGLAGKQPHALMGLGTLGGFAYDLNGNQTLAPGRSASWTSFDMPLQLVKGGTAGSDCGAFAGTGSCFNYGPEHQRVKQTRSDGTTIVYAGGQELETDNHQQVTVRTYWPLGVGVEIDRPNATSTELNWRYVDNLGSPVALTDEQGGLREQLEYDPWGKRRSTVDNVSTADTIDGKVDNKGYTGHEMLDQLDLVHMNGRVYDPYTAKFLSADPYVTDFYNGQNYNRYSYVLNNPTNLTDPTGYEWTEYIPVYGNIGPFRDSIREGQFYAAAAFGGLAILDGATLGVSSMVEAPFKAALKKALQREIVKETLAKEGAQQAVHATEKAASEVAHAAEQAAGKAEKAAAEGKEAAVNGSERAKMGGGEKPPRSKKFKDETWEQNKAANDGAAKCENCAKDVEPGTKLNKGDQVPGNRGEADHKKRLADGGKDNAKENGQLLCHDCHVDKTARENRKPNPIPQPEPPPPPPNERI